MSESRGAAPRSRRGGVTASVVGAALVASSMVVQPGQATEVKVLKADTQAAFLSGTLDGVSVDPLGSLRLADRIDRLTALGEPFVFAAVPVPDGWVVGTGNSGKVLKIDRKGEVEELLTAAEPEIFALWANPDGTVFAGSSPNGKVYRIPRKGEPEELFVPGEDYIWSIVGAKDGSLLVATGTQGKLYRVTPDGKGEVVVDSDDTHLRSLLPLPDGGALIGTAGEGLVLRLWPDGRVQSLFDATQPEVVSLVGDEKGNWYAALLASEASFVDLSAPKPKEKTEGGEGEGDAEAAVDTTITVVAGEPAAGSRPAGGTGPRSVVIRLTPDGVVENLWNFDQETVYSLAWQGSRLWVGTGLDGKLYSFDGTAMVLEADIEERQIVALLSPGRGGVRAPAFVSTNAAAFFRPTGEARATGTYTSPTLDAGQTARFGMLHWDGELPRGAEVRYSFRSGLSADPDATWSPWRPGVGRTGREVAVGDLPAGRYVQWKAELSAGEGGGVDASPRITVVELSFRQQNLRPKIDSFQVLDPGQVLVPSSFTPGAQIYEPVTPDRNGMFETLAPSGADDPSGRLKPLWRKGYRTLRWKAVDPNAEPLRYTLTFRPEDEASWLGLVEEIAEDYYSFDSTALPDGLYRFRLEAGDALRNAGASALVAEAISESVVIDHTPPQVESTRREGDTVRVEVHDVLSPIRRAEVSADAGDWEPLETEDGLLDGRREVLLVKVPKEARYVVVRLMDAAWNTVAVPVLGAAPAAATGGAGRRQP